MQQTAAQPTAAQQTAAQQTAAQQTAAQMEESVATTLKIASDWKAKGDVRWELSCVGQVLEGLLTIAVTHHDSFEAGVAYLHGKHAEELLARYHELNTALLNAFFADPKGARAAVDHQVSFAHIGWLLGRYALGDAILQIASNTEIAKYWPLTKFWTEYHRAMTCLVSREAYIPQPPSKLRGYEKHWEPYLRVVEAITVGRRPGAGARGLRRLVHAPEPRQAAQQLPVRRERARSRAVGIPAAVNSCPLERRKLTTPRRRGPRSPPRPSP